MATKFIHYEIKNGTEYASIYTPQRINGKKINDPEYLGRVIDKELGIYKSHKRGIFTYDIVNGYGDVKKDALLDSAIVITTEEKLILDFGDAYSLYTALKEHELYDIVYSLLPGRGDTLMSLIGYKILSDKSNLYAEDWWEGSYARILFPQAGLRSQRISEFYEQLGKEPVQRSFFKSYFNFLCKERKVGVLIDSTGLPNEIHFPLTAVNTHSGITSNETRLILVVDRYTNMPLFFRYNAGNIVDVTTLRSTIIELSAYGVKTDYAIVDASYYSENNIKSLYGNGDKNEKISFLTRLVSNRKLYKQLVEDHAEDLNQSKYMLMQRTRLLSIKRVAVDLFGNEGFAYIAIDHERRNEEVRKYMWAALANKDISNEEMDKALKVKGLFVLISSEKIETDEVMPLYYTRQNIEQIFDIEKNYLELLPLRTHSEETFRGHLMLSFIASVVYLLINKKFKDTPYNMEGAFMILRNQKCKVFENQVLPKETTKKMNEIYKKLNLLPPSLISHVW